MFCHPKKPMMAPVTGPVSTQIMPPKVHPTQYQMFQKTCEYIVPEIHPSHTDYVTHHNYKHIHSFPQTVSYNQTVSNQQFVQPPSPPVVVPPTGPAPVAGVPYGAAPTAGYGAPGAGFGTAPAAGIGNGTPVAPPAGMAPRRFF